MSHPGFVIRRLRNEAGSPFKFPTAGVVLDHGDEADIVYAADQAVPHGFVQVGKDVPCREDGTPLVARDEADAADADAADKPRRRKAGDMTAEA